MKTLTYTVDLCVVGGGLSGMCASIAAARHGAKVALVHDRPVFGGNASSEIRMWPLGAHGSNRRETGIFEELVLENMRVNPMRTYPNWDAVLYSAVYEQDNLDCFMNCTVNDLQTENGKITEITGWQLTTYTTHKITADLFIDCSGDSILAELVDAEYMVGREAKETFGESWGLEKADKKTMGMSLMIQAHETDHKCEFIAPDCQKIEGENCFNSCTELKSVSLPSVTTFEDDGDGVLQTFNLCDNLETVVLSKDLETIPSMLFINLTKAKKRLFLGNIYYTLL